MLDYNFNCGDLINITEPDLPSGKNHSYTRPVVFIDNSVPDYMLDDWKKKEEFSFIQINNQKLHRFYKVFVIEDGDYEWFDLPYWHFEKVS